MAPLHVLALLATGLLFVDGQSKCFTPIGGESDCKSILECSPLISLFNNEQRTTEQEEYLRNSFCGYEDDIPKVCCSNPCSTPDGKSGDCVHINSCGHLANMQKSSLEEDIQFVQKSRCEGPGPNFVCCGPPPDGEQAACATILSAYPPDPNSDCCGIENSADNRIGGGVATGIDQYPWLVLIEYVQGDQVYTSCGGSLISSKYVLTAAHCVYGRLAHGPAKNIRLGEYNTSTEGPDCFLVEDDYCDNTDGAEVIPVERVILHPGYKKELTLYSVSKHDIALIRMQWAAPYTDFIRPICLPSADLSASPPVNWTLYAAGWGAVSAEKLSSDVKQHVPLPFVDLETCQAAYSLPNRYSELWRGQICAGGQAGKDSCKGDSGGPLMYTEGRYAEIIGIVSFGHDKCGSVGVPAVYTKVFQYLNWIRKTMEP